MDGPVYTLNISPIYSVIHEKDGSKAVNYIEMVELAGTAPASAGLSDSESSTGLVRFNVLITGF